MARLVLPAKPHCRHASNTMTATAFDKFRLRCSGSMGRRRRCAGAMLSRTAGGRPALSRPNRSQSPGWKLVWWACCVPLVVRANRRCGLGWAASRNACQLAWRWTLAYSW